MGLVDDLVSQSASANAKQPHISRWLESLDADTRAEWLEVFAKAGHGHGEISVPVIRRALDGHGCHVAESTVRKWLAVHFAAYQDG